MSLNIGVTASPLMIGGGLILAVAAIILFSSPDVDKKLRERIVSLHTANTRSGDDAGAGILDEPEKKSLTVRIAGLLGYRPDLPAPYAARLKVIVPIAVAIALGVFRLFEPITTALPAGALGATAALVVSVMLFKRKTAAYRAILFRQIPDTMSLMLRAVRAGLPVAEAIRSISRESVSPTREEFTRVAAETALGMPIELTLQRLFERTGIQEYAFFSVVIGLHGQTGGNLAETLENLADMVRRRVAMVGKARALAAEGRLSAMVIGGLPFAVAGLISIVNPGYLDEFVDNPNGQLMLVAFAVLLTMGMFATHWLTQKSVQD